MQTAYRNSRWQQLYRAIVTSGFHLIFNLVAMALFLIVGQTIDMVQQIAYSGSFVSYELVMFAVSIALFSLWSWFSLRMIFDLTTLSKNQDVFISTITYFKTNTMVPRENYYADGIGERTPRVVAMLLPLFIAIFALTKGYVNIAIYAFLSGVIVLAFLYFRHRNFDQDEQVVRLKNKTIFILLFSLFIILSTLAIFWMELFNELFYGLNLILVGLGCMLFGLTIGSHLLFDLLATNNQRSFWFKFVARPYPIIIFAIGFPLLVGWLPSADNHQVRIIENRMPPAAQYQSIDAAWNAFKPNAAAKGFSFTTQNNQKVVPVFFIASQGGGLRAAYWSGLALTHLEAMLPGFEHNIFSLTGASGGTVGNTFYLASRQIENTAIEASSCTPDDGIVQISYANPVLAKRACLLNNAIGRDYLSAVTTSFLYNDLLYRFFPIPLPVYQRDRAEYLERAFESGFADAYTNVASPFATKGLESPYLALYDGKNRGWQPLLIGTSTIQELGMLSLYAPFDIEASTFSNKVDLADYLGGNIDKKGNVDLRLSTLALNSARFPYITPTGTIDKTLPRKDKWHLADAGYFDNYGASVTGAIIEAIFDDINISNAQSQNDIIYLPIPVIFTNSIYQDMNRPDNPEAMFDISKPAIYANTKSSLAHELTSPIQALTSIRGGLANTMLHDLIKQQQSYAALASRLLSDCDDPNTRKLASLMYPNAPFIVMNFKAEEEAENANINPPLGWWLSAASKQKLLDQIQAYPLRDCKVSG